MVGIIGWTSTFLLSLCGIPLAFQAWKEGHANGVNKLFLWMWFIGEFSAMVYVLLQHGFDGPLMINYWFNLLLVAIVLRYKHFKRYTKRQN